MRPTDRPAALLAGLAVALLSTLGLTALAGPSAADEYAYPTSPNDPPGANDWTCRPTSGHPRPVILVHGTFGDRTHLWEPISARLSQEGYCVFSLDYGNRATGPIEESAQQLADFTAQVRQATGARKVSMVGHSQGGMMPRYYIAFLGGRRYVDDLVGIAPSNHGTTVGSSTLFADGGQSGGFSGGYGCTSCEQQTAGSDFLTRLNSGDETPGKVSYTNIVTRHDEVVVPYTSGYLEGGRDTRQLTNVAVQDTCPADLSDHVLVPTSPTTYGWVSDALAHRGPADPHAAIGCGG